MRRFEKACAQLTPETERLCVIEAFVIEIAMISLSVVNGLGKSRNAGFAYSRSPSNCNI